MKTRQRNNKQKLKTKKIARWKCMQPPLRVYESKFADPVSQSAVTKSNPLDLSLFFSGNQTRPYSSLHHPQSSFFTFFLSLPNQKSNEISNAKNSRGTSEDHSFREKIGCWHSPSTRSWLSLTWVLATMHTPRMSLLLSRSGLSSLFSSLSFASHAHQTGRVKAARRCFIFSREQIRGALFLSLSKDTRKWADPRRANLLRSSRAFCSSFFSFAATNYLWTWTVDHLACGTLKNATNLRQSPKLTWNIT